MELMTERWVFAAAPAFGGSHFRVEQQVQGAGGAWDFASRNASVLVSPQFVVE
jgi:hypothetical protein